MYTMENEGRIYCYSGKGERSSEKSFTIIWEIENSKYFYDAGEKLQCPVVFVDVMERTSWRLVLSRLPSEKCIYVTVKREAEDHGPEQFDLHYDFDINPKEEGELENTSHFHAFRKDGSGPPVLVCKDELGKNSYRPHNTTIRCIMKKVNGPISMSGQCIARTRIGGEYFEFIEKVENFLNLPEGAKKTTLKVTSSSAGERIMTINISKRRISRLAYEIVIDMMPMVIKSQYRYFFSCTILNHSGNETRLKQCCESTLQNAKQSLHFVCQSGIFKPGFLFPHGVLNLLFKISILTGKKSEEIGKIEYEKVSSEDVNQRVCSSPDLEKLVPAGASSFLYESDPKFCDQSQISSSVVSKRNDNLNNPFPNALEDITSFYKKAILCDVKLQTATETFPAHKVILSARSPVFEAMFTSDMKEKIEECVHIDDVDAETVKRMLLCLYSDSLAELKWEEAKKLYFAADKYQVLSLKHRCAVMLKASTDLFNCCELLLLADMHQDKYLKAAVQHYITKHDKEVFMSAQWRDMEKSHPHLAIDVFRTVHMKNS